MGDSAPLGRREQNKRDKRDRVRKAAWELFKRHGFDGTTTRAIAEQAGIANGTLFLYADDKTDLVFLVLEHRLEQCVDEAFATLDREAEFVDQLMHLFRLAFAMYEEAPDLGRRFIKELPGARTGNASRVHTLTLDFLSRVALLFAEAQRRGEVRADAAPLQVAQAAFSLYFAALLGWLSGAVPKDEALERQLLGSLRLLERGFGALR